VGARFESIRSPVAQDLDVTGLEDGVLLAERPGSRPIPAVEVCETLPDGTEFKVVWSLLRPCNVAKLVTVHFFDRG
jgi:hypothetical protein